MKLYLFICQLLESVVNIYIFIIFFKCFSPDRTFFFLIILFFLAREEGSDGLSRPAGVTASVTIHHLPLPPCFIH